MPHHGGGVSTVSYLTCPLICPGTGCGAGPNFVCHRDVVRRIAGISSYAEVCGDGHTDIMALPADYVSPRQGLPTCQYEGRTLCEGEDLVVGSDNSMTFSWPVLASCQVLLPCYTLSDITSCRRERLSWTTPTQELFSIRSGDKAL